MLRSRLYWQLAGTSLLLVISAAALPALLGAPVGTLLVLAVLFFSLLGAARLVNRTQQLREKAQGGLRNPLSAASTNDTGDELSELQRAIHQLIEQQTALWAQIEQAQKTVQQAHEAANLATSARSEFLAILSHEIRTPLNGIMGMTQLALQTQLDAEQREYLEIVRASGDFLLAVVNDLRDFSRREAGGMPSPLVRFFLRQTLAETVKLLGLRAQQKGLELLLRVAPDVPDVLEGDPARLRQLLVNLLTNAITFTVRGEVVLSVSKAPDRGSKTEIALSASLARMDLQFDVADTGAGIPEDKLASLLHSLPGTRPAPDGGLGLSIARQLADSMGGSLWAESTVGKGSTFHFTTTFQLTRESAGDPPPGDLFAGIRTLIVDDNASSRSILAEVLESWRMRVTPVGTPNEALALLEQAGEDLFALAVVDAHMPETDGFVLVNQFRQRPPYDALPVLMLISAHRPDDALRCRQMQIPAHIMKPVHAAELLPAVQQALNVRETVRPVAPAKPVGPRPLRVLVAEANPANRQLAVVVLEKLGHTVLQASNGRDASQFLTAGGIDLLLLDPHLPEPPGLEIVVAVRTREKEQEKEHGKHTSSRLPILALLTYGMSEDRERCRSAGVDGFLAKPLQIQELVRAIEAVRPAAAER